MGTVIPSKPLWQSKTMWLGVATAVLPILESVGPLDVPSWGYYVIGGLIIVLRFVTRVPVSI